MEQSILFKTKSAVKQQLFIPKKVFEKIQQWCKVSPTTEWSGYLFYNYKENFENGIKLTVEDFLVSDVGNATFTEFKVDAEITQYMLLSDLLDCKIGLIHSHQQMQTFFSGTDEDTLEKEGKETCNFLSLIVNNAEQYTARITRQVITTITGVSTVTTKCFDDNFSDTKNINYSKVTGIEWFPLEIVIEGKNDSINKDILDRYKELTAKKVTNYKSIYPSLFDNHDTDNKRFISLNFSKEKDEEVELKDVGTFYSKAPIDLHTLYDVTYKLVSANVCSQCNNIDDIRKYVEKDMVKTLDNYFSDIFTYTDYIERLCDYILSHIEDDKLERYINYDNSDEDITVSIMCIYAYNIAKLLRTMKSNDYIDNILDILNTYMFSNEF